jgi:hypothetical protein
LRLVVALCGVLSGAAALGFGWWGQQTLLFETKALSPTFYVLVVLFVHLLALGSIGGGMAVLVAPRVGRVAMLSSAVGWLLLIALLGGGIKPVVALLMALSAAGGLGAFLPSVQTPLFRLERVDAPMWQPPRRRQRPAPRPRAKPQVRAMPAPPPPVVFEAPQPTPVAYEDHSQPFVAPPEEEEDHSRPFVEPPPEASPAIGAVERGDFFDSRRRNAPPPRPSRRRRSGTNWASVAGMAVLVLGVGGVAIAVVYDSLTNEGGTLMPATASVAEASSEASQAASEEKVAAAEPSSSSSPSSSRALSSEEDRLPSGPPNLALMPSQQASSSESAEIDLADDPDLASSSSASSASASVAAISSLLPSVDASMAALPPITPPSTFSTPFDYCASVANTDSPDAKKITGGVAELTRQARTEAALPSGEVRWRCMESAVWVCVQPAGSLSCDKVPSATDRVLICAAHPDTPGIRNAGGDWSCNGFTPVVSAAQLNAADRRGFDKAAWKKLTPPPPPTG